MSAEEHDFLNHPNLACDRLGAVVLGCNNEFFAPAANMLKKEEPVWIADKYTEQGKWMDGWESQRLGASRRGGCDWVIVHLGVRGVIKGFVLDTTHFTGNYAPEAAIDAYNMGTSNVTEGVRERRTEQAIMVLSKKTEWTEILPRQSLGPSKKFYFPIDNDQQWSHLRLRIFPDGGVARLRAHGQVLPDWEMIPKHSVIDLAALENGGRVVRYSNQHFGEATNLNMPGFAIGMYDGWETARNRDPGHVCDWADIELGAPGIVGALEVDTSYFRGNFPDRVTVQGVYLQPGESLSDAKWDTLLSPVSLDPNKRHLFEETNLEKKGPFTHVRLNIFPDGGIARLRVFGVRE